MKILYVGNHDQRSSNDDEGAISFALERLGHIVVKVTESIPQAKVVEISDQFDLVLFHKWEDYGALEKIKTFKAFWYFDLVDYDEPDINARCLRRCEWMDRIVPLVDMGFCTDGDWVNANAWRRQKLVRLTQGADSRFMRPKPEVTVSKDGLLFTGCFNGGAGRKDFVNFLQREYSSIFRWVPNGCHQEKLAMAIAHADIVVAPDHPATDHYWSNRVYLTLGFGGFLLHPYCRDLADQYKDKEEIVFYHNRDDFRDKVDYYLTAVDEREAIARAGYRRTFYQHTYLHRCKILEQMVNHAKTDNG